MRLLLLLVSVLIAGCTIATLPLSPCLSFRVFVLDCAKPHPFRCPPFELSWAQYMYREWGGVL